MDMELGGEDVMISPMSREQIFYKICEILKNGSLVDMDVEIRMASNMTESLGLDSLDLVDLAVEIRNEFGVNISDADFYRMNTYTVGMVCEVVEREMAKAAAR